MADDLNVGAGEDVSPEDAPQTEETPAGEEGAGEEAPAPEETPEA